MAEDARISCAIIEHPKTVKLERRCGGPAGFKSLIGLILWAAANRPDGDLGGLTDEDLEIAAKWTGPAGVFIKAMAEVRFLDGSSGKRQMHDWDDWNPYAAGFYSRSLAGTRAVLEREVRRGRKTREEVDKILERKAKKVYGSINGRSSNDHRPDIEPIIAPLSESAFPIIPASDSGPGPVSGPASAPDSGPVPGPAPPDVSAGPERAVKDSGGAEKIAPPAIRGRPPPGARSALPSPGSTSPPLNGHRPEPPPKPGAVVWDSYSGAFERRYGVAPPRNAKANTLCKQLCERLPQAAAPAVAGWYVGHPDAFYARAKHPLDLLLRDAEKLHTEWQTGSVSTSISARQGESLAHHGQIAHELKQEFGHGPK